MNEYADLAGSRQIRPSGRGLDLLPAGLPANQRYCAWRVPKTYHPSSAAAEMWVAGAFFHMVDVALDVFVTVMMSDAVEPHLVATARAGNPVAMRDAADAFMKCRATFGAAYPDFQVVGGVVHRSAPGANPARNWLTENYAD